MKDFDISVKIIELRVKYGLTQVDLAKLLETTQSVIARLESGNYNRCSLLTLRKIAEATRTKLEINFREIPLKKAS